MFLCCNSRIIEVETTWNITSTRTGIFVKRPHFLFTKDKHKKLATLISLIIIGNLIIIANIGVAPPQHFKPRKSNSQANNIGGFDLILFTSVIKNTLVKTLNISDEGPHRQTNEINNLKIYLIDEDTRQQQVNLV